MQDKREDPSKVLEALASYFIEDKQTEAEIDADLQALGYDPQVLATRMTSLLKSVDKAEGLAKLQKARVERLADQSSLNTSISYPDNRDFLMAEIRKTLTELENVHQREPQLAWRNFDRMGLEDLKAVLQALKQELERLH